MTKAINVLIIEHEGLLIDILKGAFENLNNKNTHFKLIVAKSCTAALKAVENTKILDLVLLNINIPPCQGEKVLFMDNICLKLRRSFPNIKMVVFSSFKNTTHLHSLFKTVNPECLLVKSDIDYPELINAIKTVIADAPYYSKSVLRYMRKRISNDMVIDHTDKAILHYLSIGTKMKDLPKHVNLSKSAIELRKRRLKEFLGVEKKPDYDLIQCASEKGLI